MASAEDIIDRYKAMGRRRSAWEPLWQDLFDFFIPARTPLMGDNERGKQRGDRRFDSTGSHFMSRLASTMQELMVSPAERWLDVNAMGVPDNQELAEWLDASADLLLEELRRSNFYSEIGGAYEDLACIATTAMYVEEMPVVRQGFNGFVFRTMAPGEFSIDENDMGEVDTYARELKLTPRQAVLKFGKDKVSARIVEALADKNNDQNFEFAHLIYRRDDPLLGEEEPTPNDRSIKGMEWRSVYVECAEKKIVLESGYRDQRHFAARWKRSSGEMYGRGPAMDALPDVKSLNTLVKYGLEGLVLDVYPPWLFPNESIIGNLSLLPGARNVYNPNMKGDVKSLTSDRNLRGALLKEEQMRESISRAFLDDVFGLREQGDVTATEVLDRRERRQQVTGPAAMRIQNELLDPMLSTCWMMMFRAGAFGNPPELLRNVDRLELSFISPLSRSQKLGAVRSLQDTFGVLQPLFEARPDIGDNYDWDEIARDVPEDMGVPRKWLLDTELRDQQREARAQAAQQQAGVEQGTQIAETAAKVAAVQ